MRDRITVLSGLAHRQADNLGDGNGDHARGTAVWLTGVHAWDRGRGGVGRRPAGDDRRSNRGERHRQGHAAAVARAEPRKRDADRLRFGGLLFLEHDFVEVADDPAADGAASADGVRAAVRPGQHAGAAPGAGSGGPSNILDSVLDEVAGLQKTLGSGDQAKLTEYLEAVREIEQRIQRAEQDSAAGAFALPTRPDDIPESFEDYVTLMFDLQVLAYQADITRVVTMLMGRETSPRTFEQIGVPEQHHSCSHHIDNPELMARKAKIDQYHVALFGQFLEKLKATPDGDGNLLDHSMILYGGGLGNGNLHDHVNLPVLVAGGGAGTLSGGQHINYPDNTPMANLLLTMLDKAGVPTPKRSATAPSI